MPGPLRLLLLALALSACSRGEDGHAAARERLKEYAVSEVPAGATPLGVVFDGKLKLVGYELRPATLRPGKQYTLTFYWRAEKPVAKELRLGTEILDEAGKSILDLGDSGPLRKLEKGKPALPPAAWEPNKVYVDVQSFRLPRGATKKIQIVAELGDGHERAKVTTGTHESNRAVVATLDVERPKRKSSPPRVPNTHVEKLEPGVQIEIDGKLDEAAWKAVPALGFVDVTNGEANKTFPVDGTVRLLWNDLGFYVGFDVRDPDVVGGFEKNAKDPHLWTRDAVEIMIDPDGDGDNENYYEIQINPQNLVFDSRFDRYNEPKTEPNGPFGHQSWSSLVKSAVKIEGTIDQKDDRDTGYVIEALVPWKSLALAKKSPPALGDTWRMNFYAMQENSGVAWSPILGQGNFHKASRFGRVVWTERGGQVKAQTESASDPAPSAASAEVARRSRAPRLRAPTLSTSNPHVKPAP